MYALASTVSYSGNDEQLNVVHVGITQAIAATMGGVAMSTMGVAMPLSAGIPLIVSLCDVGSADAGITTPGVIVGGVSGAMIGDQIITTANYTPVVAKALGGYTAHMLGLGALAVAHPVICVLGTATAGVVAAKDIHKIVQNIIH